MSRVTALPGCHLVPYPDHLEQQCERQSIVKGKVRTEVAIVKYTCVSNQKGESH